MKINDISYIELFSIKESLFDYITTAYKLFNRIRITDKQGNLLANIHFRNNEISSISFFPYYVKYLNNDWAGIEIKHWKDEWAVNYFQIDPSILFENKIFLTLLENIFEPV